MYIVGIDLGTTHCAVAYVRPQLGANAPVETFPIHQFARVGEARASPLFPSCLYLPAPGELPDEALRLPWGEINNPITGELARWQGSRVPGRLVASAKSWLCHPGVDRSAPILPWGAPPDVSKISPVEASAKLLLHMRRAWDGAHPDAPLAQQETVITVPASFDEAARALTVTAARQAGLEKFRLLEEPQAAFYDFTSQHRQNLARKLEGVRLALVVDVGGGTTDFTLVHVGVSPEGPMLRRIAVGEHLMLGGDNMDAALAHHLEQKLATGGKKLSAAQWVQLVQAARLAKETILSAQTPERHGISLLSEGSRLLGAKPLSTEATRAEVEQIILDGFFPRITGDETPKRAARAALQELGLPYAQDPGITRHLAAFLRAHVQSASAALGESVGEHLPRPDAILLNGGVFNSPQLTQRLRETVSSWWPDKPAIPLLEHHSLDLAVSRGAAYYGLVRQGFGLRIGGGAARAYYIGLQRDPDATKTKTVCLIPRGFEEGETVNLTSTPFTLALGRPVQFPLFASSGDRVDKPGALVEQAEDFRALPPIHTVLKGKETGAKEVPVHIQASLTEIGTLELFCLSNVADERWRLEFELRGHADRAGLTVTESMPARFSEAREQVERIYGHKPLPVGSKDVKQLLRSLEKLLGPKETWRVPLLREIWSALFSGASKRRRSPDHERAFYQLLGFSLRPGFGYPLDGWRCEQTFRLFTELVQFHAEKATWNEFWVLWRRIAGGLDEPAQDKIWVYLKPHLERNVPAQTPIKAPKLKGIQPFGTDEMVRAAASLEHLNPEDKELLGGWIADRLSTPDGAGGPWAWALGRIGQRIPLYGSSHKTVSIETAEQWLELLLRVGLKKIDGGLFAAVQLSRMSGDRTRDIDSGLRTRVVEALRSASAPQHWTEMVEQVVQLSQADEARAVGDTLPAGLSLSMGSLV